MASARSPDAPPRPGDILGNYVILQRLGPRPGPGCPLETFLALDERSMRDMVVRLPARPWPPGGEELFQADVEAARKLDSPFLAPFEYGELTDHGPVIAWEWVPGIDLRELLGTHGLEPRLALGILGRLLEGLAELHAHGLAHGDLHPGNVRITADGEVMLVGYVPRPFCGPTSRYPDDAKILRYAPPEWFAEGAVSPAGDVYALGLLLYELFTGHPPLPPATANRAHQNQVKLSAAMEAGTGVNPAIPEELLLVVRNLLQIEMRQRWSSAGSVRDALAAVLSEPASLEPTRPVPDRLLQPAIRRRNQSQLRQASQALAAEQPLKATCILHRLAELFDGQDFDLRVGAEDLMRRAIWHTFRLSSDPAARATERNRQEALALQLTHAARLLGLTDIQRVARRRLAVFARRDGPLKNLLPIPEDAATRQAHVTRLVQEASDRPADDLKLLELAVYTPGFHTTDASRFDEMRVDLLLKHELYHAAFYHRALALAERGRDPMLLESLNELLSLALSQVAAEYGIAAPPRAEGDPLSVPPAPGSLPPPAGASTASHPSTPPGDARPTSSPGSRPPMRSSIPPPRILRLPPRAVEVKPGQALSGEDTTYLLAEGRAMTAMGDVPEAIRNYYQLQAAGALNAKDFDATVGADLRNLVWLSVVPPPARRPPVELLGKLYELIMVVKPAQLPSVAERLFLSKLPEDRRQQWIDDVLGRNPWSIPGNRAALQLAEAEGSEERQLKHLIALTQEVLEVGAVAYASQLVGRAAALAPDDSTVRELQRVAERAAERHRRAGAVFADLRAKVEASAMKTFLVPELEGFLEQHPGFLPALDLRARLAEELGDDNRSAELNEKLAEVALVVEREPLARAHLRKCLATAPHNDNALLLLAALSDPVDTDGAQVFDLRIGLLVREGLHEAAIELARAQLTGTKDDLMVFELMADLQRRAGLDPSPSLVAQGKVARLAGHLDMARECLEQALEEAKDPLACVDSILAMEGASEVFAEGELERRRAAILARPR